MVHLQRLTNLQILDLKFTNVTDAGLAHFKGMNLKKLTIPTEARTDQGLQHYLAAVEPPIELDFGGNVGVPEWKLTDAGLVHLKGLTSLQNITLPRRITDAGLVQIKDLTSLQSLNLFETKITDAGLVHLKGLTNLREFYLDETKITDKGLVHLKGLTNLKVLQILETKITAAGIAELKKAFPKCQISK